MLNEAVARAVEFESQKIYQSEQHPAYTAWVKFFAGPDGAWFLSFVEKLKTGKRAVMPSPEYIYGMGLPVGYIAGGKYDTEIVTLRSDDKCRSWQEISRARYSDGGISTPMPLSWIGGSSFLGGTYPYSTDPADKQNETVFRSDDWGMTWEILPALASDKSAVYPYQMRRLRDDTLVWMVHISHPWGKGTDFPTRTCKNLNAINHGQMCLYYSHDNAATWEGPVTIYCGDGVSETDFVELPDGDLLFINNSIFARPGRQLVRRCGRRFVPDTMEKAQHLGSDACVPETVCLTDEGILVGCMRCSRYMWSDDLGLSWWRLQDIPVLEGGIDNPQRRECYQPWMHHMGNGLVACAGHLGGDDPIDLEASAGDSSETKLVRPDEYINIHFFRVFAESRRADTRIEVDRVCDESAGRWQNTYTVRLTSGGKPLADREIEFWYVMRDQPGYVPFDPPPLTERMKTGGRSVRAMTDENGVAVVDLSTEMNSIQSIHQSYQLIARFNAEGTYPDCKPAQTAEINLYAVT